MDNGFFSLLTSRRFQINLLHSATGADRKMAVLLAGLLLSRFLTTGRRTAGTKRAAIRS